MDFLELVKTRYAVRKYSDKKVERQKMAQILEAGRMAPTAGNFQPQRLIVVESQEGMEKLAKSSKPVQNFQPPLAVVVCVDTEKTWKRPMDGKMLTDIDASIVTTHMMLQATELELGSLWVDMFDPAMVKEMFSLPVSWEPVNILLLGYPAEKPKAPELHETMRKPLYETVFDEQLKAYFD